MAKYCTNCGAPIEEGMITCMSCGSSILDEPSVAEEINEEVVAEETVAEENTQSTGETRYCSKCGRPVDKDAVVCVHCGCAVNGGNASDEQDSDNVGWGFLGFFVPIAGFILWLMWKDRMPKKARKLGIGALISVCLGAVGGITSFFPIFFI